MPDERKLTVDTHQKTYDTRLTELEKFMKQGDKNIPKGWRWGQILKHFTHTKTEDGSAYSIAEDTLLSMFERETKMENVEFVDGRYIWIGDDELEFSGKTS